MKSGGISLLRRLSCGLSLVALALVAALVLAFDFDGPRTVRAEGAEVPQPSLQDVIVGPVMQTIEGLEQRLRSLEADVGAFADSFTSRRIAAQPLCVSDESGAQTCLTKAQLDLIIDRLGACPCNGFLLHGEARVRFTAFHEQDLSSVGRRTAVAFATVCS